MSTSTVGHALPMFPSVLLSTSGAARACFFIVLVAAAATTALTHTPSALPCLSLDSGLTSVSTCSGCRSPPQPRCRHSGRSSGRPGHFLRPAAHENGTARPRWGEWEACALCCFPEFLSGIKLQLPRLVTC